MRPGSVVIAGIGQTAFGRHPGRTPAGLAVDAIRACLADAGIGKDVVDGLFLKPPTSAMEFMYGQRVAEAAGICPRIGGAWDQGGAANASLIAFAAMAIDAGQCEVALVAFADTPKTGNRAVYARPRGDGAPFGWSGTLAGYAMIARRHMQQYGTTAEQLGAVAVAARRHGAANPRAQLRKPLTLEDYLATPTLVAPLRRDDCALISDGGAAALVMSAARARALGIRRPVPILGFGQGQSSADIALRPDLTATMGAASAATAFAMAGLAPADVDVAQLYDCFTITPIVTLEDYGFCKPGQGGAFVADGGIEIGGRLPMNTSGGLLSETGMPGMQLVIEAVRQMRGEATLQVPGAKVALVSNQGGIMQTHSTLILGQ
jgi:acetyl-CoA acetyltransferase